MAGYLVAIDLALKVEALRRRSDSDPVGFWSRGPFCLPCGCPMQEPPQAPRAATGPNSSTGFDSRMTVFAGGAANVRRPRAQESTRALNRSSGDREAVAHHAIVVAYARVALVAAAVGYFGNMMLCQS